MEHSDENNSNDPDSTAAIIMNIISSIGGMKPRVEKCIDIVDSGPRSGENWQENAKPLLQKTMAHLDGLAGALQGGSGAVTDEISLVSGSHAQYTQLLHMSVLLVEAVAGWEDMRTHQGLKTMQAVMEGVDSQLKYLKKQLIIVVGSVEQVGDKLEGLFKSGGQTKAKGELLFQIKSASVEMDIAKDRVQRVEKKIHQVEKRLCCQQDRLWWYGTVTLALAVPVTVAGAALWYSQRVNNNILTGVLGFCTSGSATLYRHFRSRALAVQEGLTEVTRKESLCEELSQHFLDSRKRMKGLVNVFTDGKQEHDNCIKQAYTNAMLLESHRNISAKLP